MTSIDLPTLICWQFSSISYRLKITKVHGTLSDDILLFFIHHEPLQASNVQPPVLSIDLPGYQPYIFYVVQAPQRSNTQKF
jgi:hypothetical protein